MAIKFSIQFHELVNEDVPRSCMRLFSDQRYWEPGSNTFEMFPVPEDGFVAHYCM